MQSLLKIAVNLDSTKRNLFDVVFNQSSLNSSEFICLKHQLLDIVLFEYEKVQNVQNEILFNLLNEERDLLIRLRHQ